MADPNFLFEIPLYRTSGTNWAAVPVMAIDAESFFIQGGRGERKVFRDEELTPNQEGKYIINIEYLDLKFFLPKVDLPKEVEFPVDILEARAQRRKENAIKRNAIFDMPYKNKRLFFYIEGETLIIKLFGFDEAGKMILEPEKETTAEKIEIIHNRKAVKATKLKLGHPYLELPSEVVQKFEKVLRAAELRKLALVPAGISQLNGLQYFKFNVSIPVSMWDQVESYFEDFGNEGNMTGWLTCKPEVVREILKIS